MVPAMPSATRAILFHPGIGDDAVQRDVDHVEDADKSYH
jgi:hypothetical protein